MNTDNHFLSPILIIRIHPAQKAISYTIKLAPLTLPLSPANGGEGGGEGEAWKRKFLYYQVKETYLLIAEERPASQGVIMRLPLRLRTTSAPGSITTVVKADSTMAGPFKG